MEEASLWTLMSNSCPAAFGVVNHFLWMNQELVEMSGKNVNVCLLSRQGSCPSVRYHAVQVGGILPV